MGPQGLGLEITELRLGLPGSGGSGDDSERKEKKRNTNTVVGWPPVCPCRRKSMTKMYVKVSMDGAPILRKVDLSCFKGYLELGMALEKLFGCYGIGEAIKEENESCEYIAIYEDKDGDWMLVGDVPWMWRLLRRSPILMQLLEHSNWMFTETCKRLRIKRRSYSNGIGPHGFYS